jgi:hypothetical protein
MAGMISDLLNNLMQFRDKLLKLKLNYPFSLLFSINKAGAL